jgi:hypothetical protein
MSGNSVEHIKMPHLFLGKYFDILCIGLPSQKQEDDYS